jgi:hypothetical protein
MGRFAFGIEELGECEFVVGFLPQTETGFPHLHTTAEPVGTHRRVAHRLAERSRIGREVTRLAAVELGERGLVVSPYRKWRMGCELFSRSKSRFRPGELVTSTLIHSWPVRSSLA